MVEFEKERNIEKEIYAIINYFKILKLAEMTTKEGEDKNSFQFVGGIELVRRLVIDSKEGRIDIFENSINELFEKLKQNVEYIKNFTVSKSYFTEEALKDFNFVKRNFEETWGHYEEWVDDPSTNIFLEFMQVLPEEITQQINDLKTKSAKQKERK